MHVMQFVLLRAVSVVTRDFVPRISSARAVDYSPSNGIMNAIGPPTRNNGISAGHRNTRSGYFLVIQTSSTPFSLSISISAASFSLVGVLLGARVL